jgi:nucleoside-diphosphate-sugar epimerase
MRILLTGATGTFGGALAARGPAPGTVLRLHGRAAAPPAWAAPFEWASADLADGRGVAEALSQVDVIIHAATDPRRPDAVDVEGTRRLLAAAAACPGSARRRRRFGRASTPRRTASAAS